MTVWHSTGPKAEDGHWRTDCPGRGFCPVIDLGYERGLTPEPPKSFDTVISDAFRAGWLAGSSDPIDEEEISVAFEAWRQDL